MLRHYPQEDGQFKEERLRLGNGGKVQIIFHTFQKVGPSLTIACRRLEIALYLYR